MKLKYLIFAPIILLFGFSSCDDFLASDCIKGNKEVIKESRDFSNFNSISNYISANVRINKGSEYKVEVEADENLQNLIVINNENNNLVIKHKDNICISNPTKLEIRITMPEVNSLNVFGSGDIYIYDHFTPKELNLKINGSGNIFGDTLEIGKLNCGINGSGDIRISGEANSIISQINGSGNIDTRDMKSMSVNASISGSGDIYCYTNYLNAIINGSGDIYYKQNKMGAAFRIESKVNGSGRVKQID